MVHNSPKKKPGINFFDNILLLYDWAEISQNFGISVPMKMNKKKCYFLFIIFYKECYLWVLYYWYWRNLKTLIIYVSCNVLSFPKHRDLWMYLWVFIKKKKNNQKHSKYMFLVMLFCFCLKSVLHAFYRFGIQWAQKHLKTSSW